MGGKRRLKVLVLGPLPVDLINRTLGTELDPGDAILTANADRHIEKDHFTDYVLVKSSLALVIEEPTYIGQSPRHAGSFELVRRVVGPNGIDIVLAAVTLTRNEFGNYNVHSAYRLTEEKVTARIRRRHLCLPKKKGAG